MIPEKKFVLVTGASGLVGNELIMQLLAKNIKVKATYQNHPITYSHPGLQTVGCDILDVVHLEEIMQDVKQVFHCAALVSYDAADKYKLLQTNIEGTANLVNVALDAGIEKLVYVSSVAALGRSKDGGMITENLHWDEETNQSVYSKSKYLAELEVRRGMGEGLPAVIVNPTIILGGDNWDSGSSAIFKSAYDEFNWYTEGVTGFVDLKDVARAMIWLMNSEIVNQRFILNGENLSYKETFSMIAGCFGKKPPAKKANPFLAELVWRWEGLKGKFTNKKPLLTKESVRIALKKSYFDNNKILNALPGFEFTKIKDTIERTCNDLKEKYCL